MYEKGSEKYMSCYQLKEKRNASEWEKESIFEKYEWVQSSIVENERNKLSVNECEILNMNKFLECKEWYESVFNIEMI